MKRIALALIACAGLGFIAGNRTQPEPPAAACSPAKPAETTSAVRSDQPAETPLVAKLLPKAKPAGPVDGERTADGYFYFDADRGAWIPVDFGHPWYDHNDAPVTLAHLIAEHGHKRSSASKWTRSEIETAHANSHFWERTHGVKRSTVVVQKSNCPGGVCPSTSRSRGFFRRR
jgi:hypothetical protein